MEVDLNLLLLHIRFPWGKWSYPGRVTLEETLKQSRNNSKYYSFKSRTICTMKSRNVIRKYKHYLPLHFHAAPQRQALAERSTDVTFCICSMVIV